MENKAISNTGPLIHLTQIGLIKSLDIFKEISIPSEVKNELNRNKILIPKKIKIINLIDKWKDIAEILTNRFELDLGEAQAIALAMQEKTNYFLTDDLEARTIAEAYNIETHGTAGIILRSFREKIINKKTALQKIKELHTKSSLFITKDLINQIINSINEFKQKAA